MYINARWWVWEDITEYKRKFHSHHNAIYSSSRGCTGPRLMLLPMISLSSSFLPLCICRCRVPSLLHLCTSRLYASPSGATCPGSLAAILQLQERSAAFFGGDLRLRHAIAGRRPSSAQSY